MLKHEMETFGLLLSIHPLDRYREATKRLNVVKAKDLHLHVGQEVTLVGWQITGKTVHTKDGEPMKFVSFEDTTGIYEAVFFPKAYDAFCHMLNAPRPYLLRGRVEGNFGAVTLTVDRIQFLDGARRPSPYFLAGPSDFERDGSPGSSEHSPCALQ
jgi:DNA polymerase III alpha subunit